MKGFANSRPYSFVLAVFLAEAALAIPFVAVARSMAIGVEPLRLIIPAVQSIFVLWVLFTLGWLKSAGFGTGIRDIHVLWLPTVLAVLPVLMYGTIQVAAGPLVFYFFAIVFTGVSEEGLTRGIMIRALLSKGPWTAILVMAALFSISHLSNLAFAELDIQALAEVLLTTFSFAVLYGAVFLRTHNIWPLIVLHTIWDFLIVISGKAGPFVVEPFPASFHVSVAVVSLAYAALLARRFDTQSLQDAALAEQT